MAQLAAGYPNPNTRSADQIRMILVRDLVKRVKTPLQWMIPALKVVAKEKHDGNLEEAFQSVRSEVQKISGRDIVGAEIRAMNAQSHV